MGYEVKSQKMQMVLTSSSSYSSSASASASASSSSCLEGGQGNSPELPSVRENFPAVPPGLSQDTFLTGAAAGNQ